MFDKKYMKDPFELIKLSFLHKRMLSLLITIIIIDYEVEFP